MWHGLNLLQISCGACKRTFHKLAFCVGEASEMENNIQFTCKQCVLGLGETCAVSFNIYNNCLKNHF